MTDTLNIHHVNANSLRSKTKQHSMNDYIKNHEPHIMLIGETKLNDNFRLNFQNYVLHRTDRMVNNGGGTAILIRDDLSVETLPSPSNIGIECTATKIMLNATNHLTVVAAYIPDQSLKTDDLNIIMSHFGPTNVILAGDLNAKHTTWNNNRNNPNGIVLFDWAADNIAGYEVKFPSEATCS